MEMQMFHTQENRGTILTEPILCTHNLAWLGSAYYFWRDLQDAEVWGKTAKENDYQIYSANIISQKVLDTVFNEAHYLFFLKTLHHLADEFVKNTGTHLTKEEISDYLNNRAGWKSDLDVILFADSPWSKDKFFPFPIRKRIQAAVYNPNCIHNFKLFDYGRLG